MDFKIFKPNDMPTDLWGAYQQLRDADVLKDNPLFDPHFARLIGGARPDTRIVMVSQADTPVAFWPMHVRPGYWARPIGGPFSDWHGPVIASGADISAVDILYGAGLCGMTVHGLQSVDAFQPLSHVDLHGCHVTDISMGFDKYLKYQTRLFPKHFKKMRRVRRKLENDFSSLEFTYDDPDPQALEWLISNKRAQFQDTNRHDVLGSDWAGQYIDALRHSSSDRFGSALMTLRVDGRLAAAELNLISDRVMHGWLISYEPDFGNYSPGYILWHEGLKMISQRGLTDYDCGPGMKYYKKYYTNYMLPQGSGVLRSNRNNFSPSRIMGTTWCRAEQVIPGRGGEFMAKARRRMDQIAVSETSTRARMKSLVGAIRKTGA